MAMTLATRFNSRRRPVSFATHGYVELLVGPARLVIGAMAPRLQRARLFYAIAGTAILAVWAVSSYGRTRVVPQDSARTSR